MAGYIFIPVATPEMLEFAHNWQQGQQEKGKTPYQILHSAESGWQKGARQKLGLGALKCVTAADKVYILAHGAALGSSAIGACRGGEKVAAFGSDQWQGGTLKSYTAAALARLLEKEGLAKHNMDVRVFACGSGNTPATATRSFAEELALELRALGYPNGLRVTGYLGSVRSSYSIRQIPHQMGSYTPGHHKGVEIGGEIFPASTHKVVF